MQRIMVLIGCLLCSAASFAASDRERDCSAQIAQWLDPSSGERLSSQALFERLARSPVVLLGESHATPANHRWQAYVLAGIHAHKPDLKVGFEMLPRRAQSALDAWSAGRLDETEFLQQVDWKRVWGYPAEHYLPLLHFARLHRLPTVALNVDRELVAKVGRDGWQGVAESEREGVSTPAPASPAYREALAEIYALKASLRAEQEGREADEDALDREQIMATPEFSHFVDAQLTWDRAMAEALAAAYRRDPSATVVGIVGRGHAEYGYGIPHQLAALGIDAGTILLPLDADEPCNELPADIADAVFVVDADGEAETPPRPQLGVFIEDDPAGVRVTEVISGSVAEQSGILQGDLILTAAGFDTTSTAQLIDIIRRQAPGTWLPVTVRRGDATRALVAKFPQSFE